MNADFGVGHKLLSKTDYVPVHRNLIVEHYEVAKI